MAHESRMLIDRKLVESETGRQFDNINPATEEVLGGTADGTHADMERAVAAARHAFDNTDWSRDGEARAAGLRQLQAALEVEQERSAASFGINGGLWYGADAPFGGYKQSGIGRQCGLEGLEIFTETKTVGWPTS
ncbi:MAG: aldehyde dehydrogenase family protein [Mycobacterium sp.]|nr:aldehyde dehydrogenase family protein [Mycobacterium sp.]